MDAYSDARVYCCHDKYIAHSRLSIFIIALHVELTRGTLGRDMKYGHVILKVFGL